MKKLFILFVSLLFAGMLSCEKEVEINFPEAEQEIVVDGWIEQNKQPVVVLTRTMPYFAELDSATFRSLVVSKASVKVICDGEEEFLTFQKDTSYFPPWIYRGLKLRGEAGKTYHLEIVVYDDTLTAQTTLPNPPKLDSIWSEPSPLVDTIRQLKIRFTDNPHEENYYRIFSRIRDQDPYFEPAYASTLKDHNFNGEEVNMPVLKGYVSDHSNEDIFYPQNVQVELKFCCIDKVSYEFWKVSQFEKLNALNPFASSTNNVEGNITGGKGIWCAYGASYYLVDM